MEYPKIVLIPGKDLIQIEQELKNLAVDYNIRQYKILKDKTQLLIGGYDWPDDPNKIIYLDDILEGLKLPFFKPEPVELEWDVASCIPTDWSFVNWDIDMVNDVNYWFSTNPNFKITRTDKILITNIVNDCIHEENKTLEIYKILKATFLHPHIQTLINCCACHKKAHVDMWTNVKKKFELENKPPISCIKNIFSKKILEFIIDDLNEIIIREEILELVTLECLSHFIAKNQLIEFIKMVQRRNKESRENAKLLKILLIQIEKMYSFLTNSINDSYKCKQENVKHINKCLKFFQFVI